MYRQTHNTCSLDNIKDELPCIQLARLKFGWTNQDLAGGKKFTVLKSPGQTPHDSK